jgi:DNA-binding GntR family transcriptional regulator
MTEIASLTESTYERIRDDLIECRLAPGGRLKTNDLSSKLGVSLGVIREALSRLSAEGLVISEPQRGYRATPLSLRELVHLSDATIIIEGICLRRAVAAGDLEWQTRVTAAHYRFANTPPQDEQGEPRISSRFVAAYSEFRRALVSACENEWLLRMRDMLHAQTERYRQVCVQLGPKRLDYRQGYPVIVEAALQRDADRAVKLLTDRLKANLTLMQKALQNSPLLVESANRPPSRSAAKTREH